MVKEELTNSFMKMRMNNGAVTMKEDGGATITWNPFNYVEYDEDLELTIDHEHYDGATIDVTIPDEIADGLIAEFYDE